MDSATVELTIPSQSEYVGVARLAASGIANRLEFNHEEIEDIKIAVSEACTNAVQYAYPDKPGKIAITFLVSNDKLEITVKDQGRGFDITKKPVTPEDDPDKVGLGLGITFMKSLMDEVEYDTQVGRGTTVRLVKYTYKSEPMPEV